MSGGRYRVVVALGALDDALPDFDASPAVREALAVGFAHDTLRAAVSARQVRDVQVATSDPAMAAVAVEAGAQVLEGCAGRDEVSLLASARMVVAEQGLKGPTAVLSSTLPCMQSGELDQALRSTAGGRVEILDLGGIRPTLRASTAGWPEDRALVPPEPALRAAWRAARARLPGLACGGAPLGGRRVAAFLGVGPATGDVLKDLALPGLSWRCA